VTCCSEECGDAEKFIIQYHVDGSGRWAICNRVTSYYLGGTDDKLLCYEKQAGPSEWWTVHLAVHPQVRIIRDGISTHQVRLHIEIIEHLNGLWVGRLCVTKSRKHRRTGQFFF